MTTLREAAQQALEVLESLQGACTDSDDGTVEALTVWCPEVIDALRAALAEPVPEQVGYASERDLDQMRCHGGGALLWGKDQLGDLSGYAPLYTAPPRRKPLRTVTYVCPVCAASLERQE